MKVERASEARLHTAVSSGGDVFDDFCEEIRRFNSTQVLMVGFIWKDIVVSSVDLEMWRVTHH